LKDEKLVIELRFPFYTFQNIKNKLEGKNERIEPVLTLSSKGQIRISDNEILGWSSLWEELRTYFMENDLYIPKL